MLQWLAKRPFRVLKNWRLRKAIANSGLFDHSFYVEHHPVEGMSPLHHYVTTGLAADFWPSPNFDPALYRQLNPDVAESGEAPLLHYIRRGRAEGRRLPDQRARLAVEVGASGLFDEHFYAAHHPEAIAAGRRPLDHFVEFGLIAGHKPSAEFDPAIYAEIYSDVDISSAFLHYIRHGRSEGRLLPDENAIVKAKIERSGLFDPHLYSARYPDVAGTGLEPLDHYLRYGAFEDRRPSLEFDTRAYLAVNPDIRAAKVDPLRHYVELGKQEGRSLPKVSLQRAELEAARKRIAESGLFDSAFYLASNPVARDEGIDPILHYLLDSVATYQDPSAAFSTTAYVAQNPDVYYNRDIPLLHYLRSGVGALPNLDSVKRLQPLQSPRLRDQDVALALMDATSYFARYGFTFESSGPTTYVADAAAALATCVPLLNTETRNPDVSIVIPVYGQMPFVLSCLDSLSRHRSRFSAEIIIADDCSPADHMTSLLRAVPWVRYHQGTTNLGFLDNCNSAAKLARGRYLVLLNSDTRVVEGWLDELIGSFDLFPKAGFIGSKLLNGDGALQEAGSIYWSDGTAANYGRNADPQAPRYNFARQVDWVSGAAIAVPLEIWTAVGGFDEAYRPAYCEDVDLAFRLRARGYEIWYQPLSVVLHFEGMTHGRDETVGIKAHQVANLKRLQQRWKGRLPGQRPGGVGPDRESRRSVTKRMLVLDSGIHKPDRDAGSVIATQIMRAYRDLGFHQTFVPMDNFAQEGRYTADYQRIGIEVLHEPFYRTIDDVLRDHPDFDYVLIFRYLVAQRAIEAIRARSPTARILFSNVDLHFLRGEREAALLDDRQLRIAAAKTQTNELAVFAKVDASLVHTPVEKDVVESRLPAPLDNILVLPWISTVTPSNDDLSTRRDVMFLGGFPHPPNADAVKFFLADVWPRLSTDLPADARFLAVGDAPPADIQALASDRVVVTGHVPLVEPYFAQTRVFVAPLRYGAGIKGKVIQSLANGVPTVATRIAVEGIGLVDGEHCLVADTPEAIAKAILRLYDEPDTWARLREGGLKFIEAHFSLSAATSICKQSLDVADATWMRREAKAREAWLRELMNYEG